MTQPVSAPPDDLAHTCHAGPTCPWAEPSDDNPDPSCGHRSCDEINREDCIGCFADEMEEVKRQEQIRAIQQPFFDAELCPIDATVLTCRGFYGAPGTGRCWGCEDGHTWAEVGGQFYDPADGAHILTIEDVR